MRRLILFAFVLLLSPASLPLATAVDAFQVRVEPHTVDPGDPFLIRITGLDKEPYPEASFGGRTLSFVRCGEDCAAAIGAADAALKPGRHKITVSSGKKKRRAYITVRHPVVPVIHITVSPDKTALSPGDEERVAREEHLLRTLWKERTEKMWKGSFELPLQNGISTQFGVKRIINKEKISFHRGIDIRGGEGEEVRASNNGTIVLSEALFFGGNTLVVSHGMGIFTVYMHLDRFCRNAGEKVSKGDIIGFVGSTGRSTGPHLHFGVKVQDASVNPVAFTKLKL
jgi:murein DD-endopeptidase MepM/ murein hydrolase activator NlpD